MPGTRFVLVLIALSMPSVATTQPANPNFPVTNGPVFALAQNEGTLYVGGQFSEISPATGAGVIFDPETGASVPGFPKVVGRVFAAAGDGAGGWYIGGLFTNVGGQPRANLAHIASNLTVTPWNPGTDEAVLALGVGVSGTLFIGGDFATAAGQSRARLAEIQVDGSATTWNPGSNGIVRALAITGGSVYAGGDFTFIGPTPRNRLAQISTSTAAVGAWNPNCNGSVRAIEIAPRPGPTVTFLVGGIFTTMGGMPRSNLAEVMTTGAPTTWNPSPNGAVYDIQDHTQVYVCGEFTLIGGFPRGRIAAVSPSTATATPWNPNADGTVNALSWSLSHIIIGGKFKHVGGQPRNHLARINEDSGVPSAFNPGPNEEVKAIAIGNGGVPASIYAGGEFSGLAGVARTNLAAIDVGSGAVLPWAPEPNAAVRVLKIVSLGIENYKVWAGGDFTVIGGQARGRLAELHPLTGAPGSFNADITTGSVFTFAFLDSTVYVGGSFTNLGGSRPYAAAFHTRTGGLQPWRPSPNGTVFSIVVIGSNSAYLGGLFTDLDGSSRNYIAGVDLEDGAGTFNPNANGPVRTLLYSYSGSILYAGGDFTTMSGQPRSRIAALTTGFPVMPTPFNPGANGIVRSLSQNGAEILVGGDFTTFGALPRPRLASFDIATGAVSSLSSAIADREVWAVVGLPPVVFAGGTFRGVGELPQAQLAMIGAFPPPICPPTGWTSMAGPSPRALTTGDFDNDGIRDLVVCNASDPPEARILRGSGSGGLGDGTFTFVQALPLTWRPTDAVFADFDADGLEDLAIAQSYNSGLLRVYRNLGGTFGTPTEYPLFGRVEGLAVADLDQDGILDLVAALLDSALVLARGGPALLKGTGTAGVWDGGFAPATRIHRVGSDANARSVLIQDFNLDGTLDVAYGPGSSLMMWMGPGGSLMCSNIGGATVFSTGYASGDFNEDGLPDIVTGGNRRFTIRLKNGSLDPNCTGNPWFLTGVNYAAAATPKDCAVLDFDQDGHLDVVYTLDSLQVVEMRAGIGNGTFGPVQQIAQMNAWGIAVGDFVGDGRPDVVVTQKDCGTVTVLTYPGAPLLGGGLQLVTPNGGEVWPAIFPSLPGDAAFAPSTPEAEGPSPATEGNAPGASIQSMQQVTWTKGPGVQGVDVFVSRNGGTSWQPIATNVPGTSMPWIVTPPASSDARIRVSDAAVAWRRDASNAPFAITSGVIGVDPGWPTVVAFAVQGANPTRGRMSFRLDLPSASDVDVQALDVRGRVVRSLASGRMPAGRHELIWNAQDDRGAAARSGIYFLRARVGSYNEVRKVVLVH